MRPYPRWMATGCIAAAAWLIALASAGATPAEPDTRPLSLDDAVARALEKNDDLIVEREALASAEEAVEGARGAYDPLLGIDAGWRRASEAVSSAFSGAPPGELAPTVESAGAGASLSRLLPSGGVVSLSADTARRTSDSAFEVLSPAYDNRVGVELRQPLLRGRAVDPARLGIRVAAADRDRAAASLVRQVQETVAAVERAYWNLVAVRREVDVRREAVALAEEQLDETQTRIEGGAAPETEIAQPRAELERRRGELIASRETVARAESALKLLILGDDDAELWATRLVPVEDAAAEVVPVDAAGAMDAALARRPEIGAAAAVVERRRAETAFARDGVRPALDAVVSYDRFGLAGGQNPRAGAVPGFPTEVPPALEGGWGDSFAGLGDGDFYDARVALVFEVPLGNRAARAAASTARHAERQAEATLAATRKTVRAEVWNAAAALETAGQRIEAARAAREAAEVQLQSERDRFGVGLSTNFLLLTRQNDLERARLDEIAALTDYRTARTEMGRATGSLLADRGIELQDRIDYQDRIEHQDRIEQDD